MNFYPKQIIYPFYYFSSLRKKNTGFYLSKLKKLIFTKKRNFFFLGRARAGIYIAVKNVVNKKKKIILLSPYTIPDVVNLVKKSGGVPIFFDFEKNSLDISIKSLLQLKILYSGRIAAILITHYNFNQINYKDIYIICKNSNIKLIEDCAITVSGYGNGIKVGSLSDFAIYSFSAFKFLNYFWGGVITYKKNINLNFKEFDKWKKLNFYDYFPQVKKIVKFQLFTNNFFFKYFTINFLKKNIYKNQYLDKIPEQKNFKLDKSYFSRPSDIALHEILRKVETYKIYLAHRRKISLVYYKFLKNISLGANTNLHKRILESECGCYLIFAKNEEHRFFLRNELLKSNFDVGKFYYNNCKEIYLFKNIKGTVPNLILVEKRLIILPTHFRITELYASLLAKKILEIY